MRLPSLETGSALLVGAMLVMLGTTFATGCGPSEPSVVSSNAPASELGDVSGLYRVSGTTAQLDGSDERRISGTIMLTQEGALYTTSYDLETTFPGEAEDVRADVVGTGKGTVEGATLIGTSETQLVVSTVPGVDPSFAFIPRVVGVRLTSTTSAEFAADGSVTMRVENQPGEGESYLPTLTVLTGVRIADSGALGSSTE